MFWLQKIYKYLNTLFFYMDEGIPGKGYLPKAQHLYYVEERYSDIDSSLPEVSLSTVPPESYHPDLRLCGPGEDKNLEERCLATLQNLARKTA